jgi:eukaryotic-like serine/threonine-protein kinase
MITKVLLLSVAAAAVANAQTLAAMFRGDAAHSGRYAMGGERIVGLQWRVSTDGDVVASPTVANGFVYVGSGSGVMYALDKRTGDARWTVNLGSPVSSSAAVANSLVYVGTRDGRLHALDVATGKQKWWVPTGPTIPFPWGHESGDMWTSSPTVANGLVLFGGGDGLLYGVSARAGSVLWRARTGGRIRGTPAVVDKRVYIGSFDGCVYAIDVATGRQIWRYDTEGAKLKSGDYGFDRRSIQSSPAVSGGVVYVGARDGFLYAIDATTGALRWRIDHHISWINSSPAVDEGVVFAGSSDAHFLQAVDATSGKELWKAQSDGIVWSSPAVAGRFVFWGDGPGRVHMTDRATGAEVSNFRTGSQIFSSPVIDGDLLFIGSGDGGVYALRLGLAAEAPKRAVFFDSTYLRASQVGNSADVARFLRNGGYETLDAKSVVKFLEDRVTDRAPSVVVFAIDLPPADAVKAPLATSLLRRYLNAGGKVVWLGLPPNIWPVEPLEGQRKSLNEVQWSAPEELLGVPHGDALFDQRGARATPSGQHWGLASRFRATWSVAPAGVTNVLALDDWGLAAAWSKEYGGAPGAGFVRVPPENLLSVYLAAEYRPR